LEEFIMQFRSVAGAWLLTVLLLALIEGPGRAQFGGADKRNPDSMFDWFVRVQWSNDELVIDKIQGRLDPELAGKLKAYVAKEGITNGKLTRAQFVEFWTKEAVPTFEARSKERGNGFGPFGGGPGGPVTPNQATSATSGEKSGEKTAEKDKPQRPHGFQPRPFNEEEARNVFKQLDRDQNGVLDPTEYRHSAIRREIDRWDFNKNGLIELDEFLAFQRDRHNEREQDRKAMLEEAEAEKKLQEEFKAFKQSKMPVNPFLPPGPILADKPPQFRSGNLPKEVPAWFKELDTNKDGQVGLDEWKAAGKDLDEFRKYDRNFDGFITVEEVLWYERNKDRLAGGLPPLPEPGKGGWGGFGGRDKAGKDGFAKRP
jgi:Ca2+-binding EF-hand superfamily protein